MTSGGDHDEAAGHEGHGHAGADEASRRAVAFGVGQQAREHGRRSDRGEDQKADAR